MKKEELVLSEFERKDNFLKQCFFNEYAKSFEECQSILKASKNSEQVINSVLNSDTLKGSQIYAELSKETPDHWKRVERDIDGWYQTISDGGGLKIGSEDFSIIVPNGRGDGEMKFAVVGKGCFNDQMLNFWTSIIGRNIDIFSFDYGKETVVTLEGRYGVYFGYGFIVFEKWD